MTVQSKIDEALNQINTLRETLGRVEAALEPVLSEAAPVPECTEAKSVDRCPLEGVLDGGVESLREINEQLDTLVGRIQL